MSVKMIKIFTWKLFVSFITGSLILPSRFTVTSQETPQEKSIGKSYILEEYQTDSALENNLKTNDTDISVVKKQGAITKTKSHFEKKNALNKFYLSGNVLRRSILNDVEEPQGFSLDEDEVNATIFSFMKFDKRDSLTNKVESELITNWDWVNVTSNGSNNSTVYAIPDGVSLTKSEMKRSPLNDFVSKNITILLENLLKNYENSQLPTHGKGYPTVVKTNILIRSMGPVSELDMDYSMDCYFRQYWRDSRLSFLGPIKSLSLSIKMLERIWRPDTYFYNGKHSYVHTITVPNKLLRITQDGDILYSMRLTIKAKCPMELRNFPMDRQSCPLILGSYAYTNQQLVYQWLNSDSVTFVPGMTLSQFDLMSFPYRNFTFTRREGDFSVLQVSFNLSRHTGYFLIQVYVPCILIVVLSWVSFWIHREATSDRVGLGITTVLTLSTISLDSRTDLPKVRYATALDWFLLMSFGYCIATLLEFAGVHYFTKVGSGEIPIDDEEWEELIEETGGDPFAARQLAARRRSSNLQKPSIIESGVRVGDNLPDPNTKDEVSVRLTMERTTQTERRIAQWKQFMYCLMGNDNFRRQRQREAENKNNGSNRQVNSVSLIDKAARILFPASFGLLNLFYWVVYVTYQEDFKWKDPPIHSLSH